MSGYDSGTRAMLAQLDDTIKHCFGSGDPLRERMAEELSRAQAAIYASPEMREER